MYKRLRDAGNIDAAKRERRQLDVDTIKLGNERRVTAGELTNDSGNKNNKRLIQNSFTRGVKCIH